jgi:tRNA-dihydrouridine synthase B
MLIGKINIENAIVLAPMESITDISFRIICKRFGADLVYSEFIASEALFRDVARSYQKMTISDEERPIAIQIFGGNLNSIVESAKKVEQKGADIIDINFGCWVKKVVNNDAGAALLKDPQRIADITSAVKSSVSIPVTVKTRLGWDDSSINILNVAQLVEKAGASAIAIHCRTRSMGMSGQADWTWIKKVKNSINIPVILNGDVKNPEDAKKAFDSTGCDAVMIGRAAIGNPFIFREIKQFLNTSSYELPTIDEKIETCLETLSLSIQYKGYPRGLYEFRKFYSGFLKGLYGASNVRQKLVLSNSFEEISFILNDYKKFLKSL